MSVHFSSASDQWATPKETYDALNAEFHFDFDPCPLAEEPEFDGLSVEWGRSTFCNPPYSKIKEWVAKAHAEATGGGQNRCSAYSVAHRYSLVARPRYEGRRDPLLARSVEIWGSKEFRAFPQRGSDLEGQR